jgi:hypothetical protein
MSAPAPGFTTALVVQPKLCNGGVLVICSPCPALHHMHAQVAAEPRSWLALQARSEAYRRTMCVGLTWWQSAAARSIDCRQPRFLGCLMPAELRRVVSAPCALVNLSIGRRVVTRQKQAAVW